MRLVRALLFLAGFALAIAACERVVRLTPIFDGGFDSGGFDSTPRDTQVLDVGEPGGMDGGIPFPDAAFGDAS